MSNPSFSTEARGPKEQAEIVIYLRGDVLLSHHLPRPENGSFFLQNPARTIAASGLQGY